MTDLPIEPYPIHVGQVGRQNVKVMRDTTEYAIPYHIACEMLHVDVEAVCEAYVFGDPEKLINPDLTKAIIEKHGIKRPYLNSMVNAYGLRPLRKAYCARYKSMKKDMEVRIESEYRRNRTQAFKKWSPEWMKRNQQATAERMRNWMHTRLDSRRLTVAEFKALANMHKILVYTEQMIIGQITLRSRGNQTLPTGLKQNQNITEIHPDDKAAQGTEIDAAEKLRIKEIAQLSPDFTQTVGKAIGDDDDT